MVLFLKIEVLHIGGVNTSGGTEKLVEGKEMAKGKG